MMFGFALIAYRSMALRHVKKWECEGCQGDIGTPMVLKDWKDKHLDDNVAEHVHPDYSSIRALGICRCFGLDCGRKARENCSTVCDQCDRGACDRCKEGLNSWCPGCKQAIKNNNDSDIGPTVKDHFICRPCFDNKPHFCGCGEPNYDLEESGEDTFLCLANQTMSALTFLNTE